MIVLSGVGKLSFRKQVFEMLTTGRYMRVPKMREIRLINRSVFDEG